MKKFLNPLFMAILVTAPLSAFARDVYPDRSIGDVYVLSVEDGKALIKTKGAEKEYVTVEDVIGEERMAVTEISALSITVKSENGETAAMLPVGGGIGH